MGNGRRVFSLTAIVTKATLANNNVVGSEMSRTSTEITLAQRLGVRSNRERGIKGG